MKVYENMRGEEIKIRNRRLREVGFIAGKEFKITYEQDKIILEVLK